MYYFHFIIGNDVTAALIFNRAASKFRLPPKKISLTSRCFLNRCIMSLSFLHCFLYVFCPGTALCVTCSLDLMSDTCGFVRILIKENGVNYFYFDFQSSVQTSIFLYFKVYFQFASAFILSFPFYFTSNSLIVFIHSFFTSSSSSDGLLFLATLFPRVLTAPGILRRRFFLLLTQAAPPPVSSPTSRGGRTGEHLSCCLSQQEHHPPPYYFHFIFLRCLLSWPRRSPQRRPE